MASAPLALFFGEDSNDTNSLIHLTHALLPQDFPLDTKALRRPPVLRRGTSIEKKKSMAQDIAGFANVLSRRRNHVAVIAHRDCDQCEDSHEANATELEAELRAAGVASAVAAVPAWELETWIMLFPAEIAATRRCWQKVDYSRRNVGSIANAKEVLRRDLRPRGRGHSCPDYTESDSITIFRLVSQNRSADDLKKLNSNSLRRFRKRLLDALNIRTES